MSQTSFININTNTGSILSLPKLPISSSSAITFIHELTSHADLIQAHVLSSILHRNCDTEYLRSVLGLPTTGNNDDDDDDDDGKGGVNASPTDLSSAYKSLAPLVTYEDLKPFIQRIANGDSSPILSSNPIYEFLTSSGTSSGERKLIPSIEEEWERRALLWSLPLLVISQYVDGLEDGKGLYFHFIKAESRTPGGLMARPILTSFFKSEWFRAASSKPRVTSPMETTLCPDSEQSMYCQLLCGLLQRHHVVRIGAVFASTLLRAISFLHKHWPKLVHDMASGTLNASMVTDVAARKAVEELLAELPPDMGAAQEVADECRKASWQGIVRRLWPRAKYVDAIITGSMSQYIPSLDYYSDKLPLLSTMYASSECFFGVNLTPLVPPSQVSYTLFPHMAYFEFLPLSSLASRSDDNNDPQADANDLVDLVKVEVGKEYELVITTYSGLYRYRVGDVLRVTGFHNKAPQFQFVCRKNVVLSIDTDKTDEETLLTAIKRAESTHLVKAKWRLVDYTSYADLTAIPGHYVIFWELIKVDNEEAKKMDIDELSSILQDCCVVIENGLDIVYRQGRVLNKCIGPLEIRVVVPGTFDTLMDYFVANGSSICQYKTPRCVKYTPIADLLNSRVTYRFFSPKLPYLVAS